MSPRPSPRVVLQSGRLISRSHRRTSVARWGACLSVGLVLSACGPGFGESSAPTTAPLGQLQLGPMPPAPPTSPPTPLPSSTVPTTVRANTVHLGQALDDVLATVAPGNRALLIGDSVLRQATPSQGGDICEAMNAFGWSTTIATRPSAGTDFAKTVLAEYFGPTGGATGDRDWDAVAIFLGTDLGTGVPKDEPVDVEAAIANIDAALEMLSPRPVLLVTVSVAGDHRGDMREFNTALQSRHEIHPNIAVLDWATITADDPKIVKSDGVSLSENGVVQLGLRFASSFGTAPEVGVVGATEATSATSSAISSDASAGSDLGCEVLATN